MADNILTKDRTDADIALAAKDITGVKFPRNILTSAAGTDIDPATSQNQAAQVVLLTSMLAALSTPASGGATETTLAAILAKLIAAPANAANQASVLTALASILAKITADPANNNTLTAVGSVLSSIDGHVDGLEGLTGTGNTTLATILSRLTARYSSATIVSVTTSATGTSFQPFASQSCVVLDLVNSTSVDIEVQRGTTGLAIPVPALTARQFDAITNASDLRVRRMDMANGQITVFGEAKS